MYGSTGQIQIYSCLRASGFRLKRITHFVLLGETELFKFITKVLLRIKLNLNRNTFLNN